MEDADIEQRFHLMQKELEASVSSMTEGKLDLIAAIDSLRIEIEVLKGYMERFHPGFAETPFCARLDQLDPSGGDLFFGLECFE